ncbi:MAG: Bdr protein [Cyanobacteria bacterium P01_F01_bin.150]
MSEPTNQDLKDLILAMDKRIMEMDQRIELRFASIERSMEVQFTELKGDIQRLDTKIDGVQAKLDTRLDGLEKRLSNEEIISRSVVGALLISVTTGLVKLLFFSNSL